MFMGSFISALDSPVSIITAILAARLMLTRVRLVLEFSLPWVDHGLEVTIDMGDDNGV
jgi:hypothetical protein